MITVTDKTKFGAAVRRARVDLGMSKKELAICIGRSATTIGRYEKGVLKPSVQMIAAICDELGLEIDELH